jgi:hypothetical protein
MGGVFYMSQNNNQSESPTTFIILGTISGFSEARAKRRGY